MKNIIIKLLEYLIYIPFLIIILLHASVQLITSALSLSGVMIIKLQDYLKGL